MVVVLGLVVIQELRLQVVVLVVEVVDLIIQVVLETLHPIHHRREILEELL
jgi:hypothetical protein